MRLFICRGGVILINKKYRVLEILNNNIILAYDFKSKMDIILMGKGIGFGKRENKKVYIPDKDIQRSFVAYDENIKKEYFRLIKEVDSSVIEISKRIIDLAESKLGDLNSNIHILFSDHIAFAIERVKTGLKIENPFIDEIKIIYPMEFDIAFEGIKMIKEELNVDLGFGEIGFIAMYLHSAKKNVKVKETVKTTRILNEIVNIIEEGLNMELDRTSYNYKRLIRHLLGTLDRIKNKKHIENCFLKNIKKEFRNSFKIIEKIKVKIEKEYELEVPEQELGYMVIHIERLKTK